MTSVAPKLSLMTSRAEVAYTMIEEMIVTLELAPGESVTEQALCSKLEMGRTPVREALLRLKHDYLLAVLPRQGILIKPIDTKTALEALDVRHHVESLLIERAARLADESRRAEFLNMAKQAEYSLAIRDNRLFSRVDKRFNERVCDAAQHEVAARAVMPLHAVSRRIGFFLAQAAHFEPETTVQPHIDMMRSIASGDESSAMASLTQLHHLTREQALTIERDGLLHL